MAFFKLNLLTPITDNSDVGVISFLETPISEFYSQEDEYNERYDNNKAFSEKNTYCYTFNEKYSIHKNGQKELSFSMVRNIWQDDSLTVNPFASSIHNGTQLLLIDKYNNEMIFTVKNIAYKLGASNITYDITCQDSFTYQAIRQNDGYTITNDSQSEDFIGAKNVDWWVYNKIQSECHICYDYVPLFMGLYLDNYGNLHTYRLNEKISNVNKILKPPYSQIQYKDYYEIIPFAISSSNASAALISLAEEIGLMLNFAECNIKNIEDNRRTTKFVRYFWFEPAKHEETSELKYSPEVSIQNFNFSHNGESLTTILNVESNTMNDEVISLLPDVPLFFTNLFNKDSNWNNTNFYDGYFTSVCQRKIFKNEMNQDGADFKYDDEVIIRDKKFLYIKINTIESGGFTLPLYYDKISFKDTEDKESVFYYKTQRVTPSTNKWNLAILEIDSTTSIPSYIELAIYNDTYSFIPDFMFGKSYNLYIKVDMGKIEEDDTIQLNNVSLILNFYRDTTQDELDFATVADSCPWLENKLIDFSYFLSQNIINKSEFNELMNIIQNDLRIINGKLLLRTKEYYQALHTKTKILAEVVNTVDSVGAAFHADVVNSFMNDGSVKDYSHFEEAYKLLDARYFAFDKPTQIMSYEELLSEYLNKYINTQQRFLKNMYNFDKFFNDKIDWGDTSLMNLYRHRVTLENSEKPSNGEHKYITFQDVKYNLIDSTFNLYDSETLEPFTTIYKQDKLSKVELITKENYKDYYKLIEEEKDTYDQLDGSEGYNEEKQYFRIVYKVKKPKNEEEVQDEGKDITLSKSYYIYKEKDKNLQFYYHSEDSDYYYYGFNYPDGSDEVKEFIKKNLKEITIGKTDENPGITFTRAFIPARMNEIVSEYLYLKAYRDIKKSSSGNYFDNIIKGWVYRTPGIYTNFSTLSDSTLPTTIYRPFVWTSYNNTNEGRYGFIWDKYNDDDNTFGTLSEDSKLILKEFYINNFPITEIYFTGPRYLEKTEQVVDSTGKPYITNYQRVNANGETLLDYLNYLSNKDNVKKVKNPFDYTIRYTLNFVTPTNIDSFYRRISAGPNGWQWTWAVAAGIGAGLGVGISIAGPVIGAVGGIHVGSLVLDAFWSDNETTWLNSGRNYKTWEDIKWTDRGFTSAYTEGYRDSIYWNYSTSQDAYENYWKIKNSLSATGYIESITIDKDNMLSSVTLNNGQEPKEHFNKYTFLGHTFSLARNDKGSLQFEDIFYKPLILDDKVNNFNSYRIICQQQLTDKDGEEKNKYFLLENDSSLSAILDNNKIFSGIRHYPLIKSSAEISFSSLKWKDETKVIKNKTLKEALIEAGYSIEKDREKTTSSQTNYWITANIPNQGKFKFAILEEISYNPNTIFKSDDFHSEAEGIYNKPLYLLQNKRFSNYTGETIYDTKEAVKINFLEEQGLVEGFFTLDNGYRKLEVEDLDNNLYANFYKEESNDFKETYTIEQLMRIKDKNFYYIQSNSIEEENFKAKPEYLEFKVFLHKDTYKEGKLINSEKIKMNEFYKFSFNNLKGSDEETLETLKQKLTDLKKELEELNNEENPTDEDKKLINEREEEYLKLSLKEWKAENSFATPKNTSTAITIKYKNEIYTSPFTCETIPLISLVGLSNGDFWYRYHSNSQYPILMQKAALIETQLTEYWQQAYSASKNCEYFLPEYWQTSVNGSPNYYSNQIFSTQTSKIKNSNSEELEATTITLSNTFIPKVKIYNSGHSIKLPKYNINFGSYIEETEDSINREINITNKQSATILKDNIAIKNIMFELDESLENLTAEEFGNNIKTTYYYADFGGIKWKNLLKTLTTASIYDNFNGTYVMIYKILKSRFINQSMKDYELILQAHNNIWDRLYREYTGVILENTYKSDSATTSKDLYTLATNAFKDMSQPERSYSITLIDPAKIEGYQGQELTIGDGILIDAEEYYDEYDDIKKTLSQYLFITDISYDLRKDSDVSLTVNSIKYQDKLIQRLVKLIK